MRDSLRLASLFIVAVFAMALSYGMGFATALRLEDSGPVAAIRDVVSPGQGSAAADAAGGASETASSQGASAASFGIFWETWKLIQDEFYGEIPEGSEVTYDAIRGSLRALDDPFTAFIDPQVSKINSVTLDGEFEGIGAYVTTSPDGLLMIQTPMPGQPAEKAGVKAGDIVIEVDGEDITNLDINEAILLIRGPKGSSVTLTIVREGETGPLEIAVVRDRIEVPSVNNAHLLEEQQAPTVGYVQLTSFAAESKDELDREIQRLRDEGAEALILDLRNNPGGYLNTAIEIVSEFIDEGVVVMQEDSDGNREPAYAKKGGLALDLPLVVLVNRGSASASEIVAGAIRDHERGVIIGETTFGKGSVQNVHQLSDGSELRVTVAAWLTPKGTLIHKKGIEPDIAVSFDGSEPDGAAADGEVESGPGEADASTKPSEVPTPEVEAPSESDAAGTDPDAASESQPRDFQLERAVREALAMIARAAP